MCYDGHMADNQVEIRRATIQDADAIAAIHVKSWQHAYKGILPQHFLDSISLAQRKERRAQLLSQNDPSQEHLVAILKGKVIGFCDLGPSFDRRLLETGEVYGLFIDPDNMGKSAGTTLLSMAERVLEQRGYKWATVWVLTLNQPGRVFYEKNGWQFDGNERTETSNNVSYQQVRYHKKFRV